MHIRQIVSGRSCDTLWFQAVSMRIKDELLPLDKHVIICHALSASRLLENWNHASTPIPPALIRRGFRTPYCHDIFRGRPGHLNEHPVRGDGGEQIPRNPVRYSTVPILPSRVPETMDRAP